MFFEYRKHTTGLDWTKQHFISPCPLCDPSTAQLTTDSDFDFFLSDLPTVSLHGEEAGADRSAPAAVPMEVAAEAEPPKTEIQETLSTGCSCQ